MGIYALDHVQIAMPAGAEAQARAFYGEILGLQEVPKPPELAQRGGCWFVGGALKLHLGVEEDFRPARKAHPAFLVLDLDGLLDRCRQQNVEMKADVPLPGYKRMHVFDPFGNRIELLEKISDDSLPGGRDVPAVTHTPVNYRIVSLPAFWVVGKKTWIAGTDDTDAFGRFWEQSRTTGLLDQLGRITAGALGQHTGGHFVGVSRVEENPARREFYFMVAVEAASPFPGEDFESYQVPESDWAVFECYGQVPASIVAAEMYAFMDWLPNSNYEHALAPEMEVYPPQLSDDPHKQYVEFWLPIRARA